MLQFRTGQTSAGVRQTPTGSPRPGCFPQHRFLPNLRHHLHPGPDSGPESESESLSVPPSLLRTSSVAHRIAHSLTYQTSEPSPGRWIVLVATECPRISGRHYRQSPQDVSHRYDIQPHLGLGAYVMMCRCGLRWPGTLAVVNTSRKSRSYSCTSSPSPSNLSQSCWIATLPVNNNKTLPNQT